MLKVIIAIVVVIVIALLVWFFFFPKPHVVQLVVCPDGPTNDEPKLVNHVTEVHDKWFHPLGEKVTFRNDSLFDGVVIQISNTNFFKQPPSEQVFTLAKGEKKTLTMRKGLPISEECVFLVNPTCDLPGPRLIRRP